MENVIRIAFLYFALSLPSYSQEIIKEGSIHGTIQLDSIWEPIVYLSLIPSLNDFNTMSNQMIIDKTKIDSLGSFYFKTRYLPKQDHFYRIHISKKNNPSASLIIGGNNENHIFFIANNSSNIKIINYNPNAIFDKVSISGYSPNQHLKDINTIIKFANEIDVNSSILKKDLIKKGLEEKLRFVADTSTHFLTSLYAVHHSNIINNFQQNQDFYNNYINKWKHEKSSYFEKFKSNFPKSTNNHIQFIIIGILCFFLGFIVHLLTSIKVKNSKKNILSLSIQERKIFQSIQQGKSNKEISEEFNIGINTVKSHTRNIYSKLNIRSRKDAVDF